MDDFAIIYPETKKVDSVDIYFGTEVRDPYRWLEDDRSKETKEWIKKQNKLTFDYLERVPYRGAIRERLKKLRDYEKVTMLQNKRGYTYYYKNHEVLYRSKDGESEVFLDPNTLSNDGTISLSKTGFSRDGKFLAYSISEGGSDWEKILVMNTISKTSVGDTISNVKFGLISWKGNEGFFYSSYDAPQQSKMSAKTDSHKLYYHKLGTKQAEDVLVFGLETKRRYVYGRVTDDDRYLIISASNSTSGNELYLLDLDKRDSKLITLVDDFNNDHVVIDNEGSKLYVLTNFNSPNNKLVTIDIKNPDKKNWIDIIPEDKYSMEVSSGGGYFFAHYIKDVISVVKQYDYSGKYIRDIDLPDLGTVTGFEGEKNDKELYFTFTNYTVPSTVYSFDIKSGDSNLYKRPEVNFDVNDYESKQVFYTSKDKTKVPMTIVYKKGIELNGKNPTILYGYGGFNISLRPSFRAFYLLWLDLGGVYAIPNLRGGGEYGKQWHIAGTKMNKQNVFDDFISAAEYLIREKYTSKDFLAIEGRSNGGLLVGSVLTQRPDLMRVALPGVGVLDMLRYHVFTSGEGWAYDFGTSEDSQEMFKYLKKYSPLHNVRKDINYPSVLVTTGDHDDRVVPAHSFKFISELQEKHKGSNPVFIRVGINVGHGKGKPMSKLIDEYADIYSFTLFNMGIKTQGFLK
ncbi:prolyl endopeptidase [Ichthyobacterium seriolicida]|uniref:prolyl oligopeptidase n=2 Tax=Ichthyobacterium seriolicida TaxID=242600 RepID=A0A1J1E8Z0_9FLAO|nr:prolyl endopeptidase [Ichthyobacterium seriolicida]